MRHQGQIVASKDGFDVITCEVCGWKHIMPLPTPEEVECLYRAYYADEKPQYIARTIEDLDWWNAIYGDRFLAFVEFAAPDRSVLDIGCGSGYFLKYGKESGWLAIGVEPSLQAYAHAAGLGLEVIQSQLTGPVTKAILGTYGRFGVVNLHEVLEHVVDPVLLLTRVWGMLREGGLVCVTVPNDFSEFQRAGSSTQDPWWIAPPHHVNYFNYQSLERLLAKCGFQTVSREGTFPIDWFLLAGDNYIGNDEVGRACHAKRKKADLAMGRMLRMKFYRTLAAGGLGRECVVIARRS